VVQAVWTTTVWKNPSKGIEIMSLMIETMASVEVFAMQVALFLEVETYSDTDGDKVEHYQRAMARNNGIQFHSIGKHFPYTIGSVGNGDSFTLDNGKMIRFPTESECILYIRDSLRIDANSWFARMEKLASDANSKGLELLGKMMSAENAMEFWGEMVRKCREKCQSNVNPT
jgi:hypothetical protein